MSSVSDAPTASSSSKSPLDPSLLCLICQYYEKITGKRREVKEVVFFKEEEEILDQWALAERLRKRNVSIEEVYEIIEKDTSDRQKKKELTEEERSMLSEDQLKLDGARIAELLKPFEMQDGGEICGGVSGDT